VRKTLKILEALILVFPLCTMTAFLLTVPFTPDDSCESLSLTAKLILAVFMLIPALVPSAVAVYILESVLITHGEVLNG
jgi:hypothetical protein